MYAYITGKLTVKQPTHVVLEAGGIGYFLHISLNTYTKIENLHEACLQVALIVKEDSHTLFGFADEDEKQLFLLLIGVSGVGANTARIILSGMDTKEIRSAILQDDHTAFQRIKGIGPKTAKQIILDLKNKIDKENQENTEITRVSDNKAVEEALFALLALGFQRPKVAAVLNKLTAKHGKDLNVEQYIRLALSEMT